MNSIFIFAVLLILAAYIIEDNGSVVLGINFSGNTGMLYWIGMILLILLCFVGISSSFKTNKTNNLWLRNNGNTGKFGI